MINQSDAVGVKRISRTVSTAVIAFVLAIVIFASTAFAGLLSEYNVDIVDNGQTLTITTNESEPIEILTGASITLAANDKLDITGFESGKGGAIVINRCNTIIIETDDTIATHEVYASTVEEALAETNTTLSENDEINYELTDAIISGMVIKINTAFSVTLSADEDTTKFSIVDGTVEDIINLAQITLEKDDYVTPSKDTGLKAGMKINVYRVTYGEEVKNEKIDYESTEKKDKSLAEGKTKVLTAGVNGTEDVTFKIKYVNGKESERTEVSRVVTKKATNEVIAVGTKKAQNKVKSNSVKSKNGYTVGQTISGKYTHYCACATCNGNGRGITASGKKISNGMDDPYYIACNWLPMGSVVEVRGKNYTVVDRGGSGLSKEGRIDIFTPEGHDACYKYGTGKVTLKIVRLGW